MAITVEDPKLSRKPLQNATLAACVLLPAWNACRLPDFRAIDWRNSIDTVFAYPRTEIPVFTPPEGVRLKMLYPDIRSIVQDTNLSALLLFNSGNNLPAEDPITGTVEFLPLSAPSETVSISKYISMRRYLFRALGKNDVFTPDTLLFAAVRYGADKPFGKQMRNEWKLINQVFFPQQVFLLVRKAPADPLAFYHDIQEKTSGGIRFYLLQQSPQQ